MLKLAKPVEGRQVRNPADGTPIPASGIVIDLNSFWNRRLKDGDITISDIVKSKVPEQPGTTSKNQST